MNFLVLIWETLVEYQVPLRAAGLAALVALCATLILKRLNYFTSVLLQQSINIQQERLAANVLIAAKQTNDRLLAQQDIDHVLGVFKAAHTETHIRLDAHDKILTTVLNELRGAIESSVCHTPPPKKLS